VHVIGVIDLRGGHAVHARAGSRDRYQPVLTVAGTPIDAGDAIALARIYVEQLHIGELYVADLDALAGRSPHAGLVADIAAIGVPLMLDAGVSAADRARQARDLGAARVVVALETLADFGALREVCGAIGADRVAFSLDLRDGRPVRAPDTTIPAEAPDAIAARARDAGAGAVIVIDVGRVGTGSGLDFELLGRVRAATPELTLFAGGGVRGADDLLRLADVGCDGALVATALHDGRIGASAIAAAAAYRSVSR
jgi:phosphoribosylformimino-5-aminoimidazole carboxamide ribotide isomerase